MRHLTVILLVLVLLSSMALACQTAPPSTPTPAITPATATAQPAVMPTLQPTTTPPLPPPPAPGPIDLGVSAGDAYNPQAMAIDTRRQLAYVVSGYGDAATSDNASVLSIVDLAGRAVQKSVELPSLFGQNTSVALAQAGDRLFVAGGDDNVMLVVATGAGSDPAGKVLAVKSDGRAVALDATSSRLYTVGEDQILKYDADTLDLLQSVSVPTQLPPPPAQILLAVNAQTSRLYVGAPASSVISVYRTDDMQKEADILVSGQPVEIDAGLASSFVQLMLRGQPDGRDRVAVVEGNQVVQIWSPEEGFFFRGIVPNDSPDRVHVWEAGGDGGARLRAVEPRSGQTMGTTALPVQGITKATIRDGELYALTWDHILMSVAVDSGQLDRVMRLGVTLSDAIVDRATRRLFVMDSAGTIHVLDTNTRQLIDTWPQIAGSPTETVFATPLSIANGHLFVPDHDANETKVLDVTTGERIATIPKAGQVTFDTARNRLFVTRQGVFIFDAATYTETGSIDETVRKTMFSGEPSAIRAEYDADHDWLLVTMTNNTPGSNARTWLQIYDGETLQRLETGIGTDQQFLSGLAIHTQQDRLYVASSFPEGDLAIFSSDGQLLKRLNHLTGQVFLDEAAERLYVTAWNGLVTVDTRSDDVIGYRRLPAGGYSQFTAYDAEHTQFYATQSNTADLLMFTPSISHPTSPVAVGKLPARQIRDLAVAADGAMMAVDDAGAVYRQMGGGWELVSTTLPPVVWPAVRPALGTPETIFAYSASFPQVFGLFRSLDAGRTWEPAMRGLKDFWIRDLALSPHFATDKTAFVLAGEDGVWQSTDGGDSWERISDVAGQHIVAASDGRTTTFLMLAQIPDVYDKIAVYALAGGTGVVEQIGEIPAPMYGGDSLAASPDFVVDGIAIAGLGRAGLFVTQDFGRSWQPVPPQPAAFGPVYTLRFSPRFSSDRTVYALIAASYFGGDDHSVFYRSTDGGQTWQQAMDADPQISALAMGPDGELWTGDANGHVLPLDPAQFTWEEAHAPTPTPTPVSAPAEPPSGRYRPEGAFANLWATDPEIRQLLGWASEATPTETPTAFQPFEHGAMIWREDSHSIYVLFGDGTWEAFADTWTSEQPDHDPNLQPPADRLQPIRGFGKVWREEPRIRDSLGWALQGEKGFTSPVQGFERGIAIGIGGAVYVLAQAETQPAMWVVR